MSSQNPIVWTGERDDPSAVGRGRAAISGIRKLGLAVAGLLLIATVVCAIVIGHHRWLILGVGVTAAAGLWYASAPAGDDVGPKGYHRRAGWSMREQRADDQLACHRLLSRAEVQIAALPECPRRLSLMAAVRRPLGEGYVAVTEPSTHRDRTVSVRSRMVVWVPLPQALPAIWLATVAPPGAFTSESVEFNNRYAPMRWTLPGRAAWETDDFLRFASDFFGPRVIRVLVEAFAGLPEIVVRGTALGAVIEPDQPYRAELTLDVLLEIRDLLPAFLFQRYAARASIDQ